MKYDETHDEPHAQIAARLDDYLTEQLDTGARAEVAAHLAGCAACRDAAAERALDGALARLPRHTPSPAFMAQLQARFVAAPVAAPAPPPPASPTSRPRSPRRWIAATTASLSLVAALVVVAVIHRPTPGAGWTLVDEVVTDHLRVVASSHPVEIESGGIHQVKPWFTGRIDFAPRVAFSGDDDFPLVGGSVGYVRDRKAAVFTFRRRLHTITLLVFPAGDLGWPAGRTAKVGGLTVDEDQRRGFNVLSWRDGDLRYALVSDVNRADLELLVPRIDPH